MSQRDVVRAGGSLFQDEGPDGFLHRAFLRGEGFGVDDVWRGPVIGIANAWSELNPCNAGLRDTAAAVKRGVEAAGGLGLEFPTISISEPFTRPTSMYLRNLMSVDVEEMIASSPIDGVVLLGGCDKTVPAQLMGAISAGKPAVMVTAGPRPVSCWKGQSLTIDDVWPLIDERRVGKLPDDEWVRLEGCLNRGVGTCNVLGTASTMAVIAEVLGFALPGTSLHPAGSAEHVAAAERAGAAAVAAVGRQAAPGDRITDASLEAAFRVLCSLGGSTNAVIHLEAIAGRVGITIGLERMREWAASTPLLASVRPSGPALLSDFVAAGGVPAVLRELRGLIDADGLETAAGEPWPHAFPTGELPQNPALRPIGEPVRADGGMALLTGSLAPNGAVIKTSASSQALRSHRGRALVFDGVAEVNARIDDPELDVDADTVMILRGVGVQGAPGMPEVGHIPIPAKLARAGVTDMVRLTDARMSGTATGTVVVHIAPEAAAGGPIGLVQDGDEIELDVDAGTLELLVEPAELQRRIAARAERPTAPRRGYDWLYAEHVLQPDQGCDFDFLRADFAGSRDA